MSDPDQLIQDVIDYGRLAIVAMIMVVVVWKVAAELIGEVPAYIGSIVGGIAAMYYLKTNKKARREIKNW